jgi:energy-coupling factor transporter ATP-binding protein EcfA2
MIDKAWDLWPCIGEAGLEIFATTADQRYLLGEDIFLKTHYPVTLRRFYSDRRSGTIKETALLEWLLHTRHAAPGNRVLIIYGAAGSGKSELMKWLHVMLARHDSVRAEATIRIARTELDVLSITERFHHLLTQSYFDEQTHRRWDEARHKPRTLAKLLLLTALERCLDADDPINALYYRLIDWIQPRIAHSLALIDHNANGSDQVELLTREDLEQLKAETALPIPLDYEQFRHHLMDAFREHLLEGINLPETLRLVSEDITRRRGMRPVLLVDDLVQSVNLFATDLLDYFITLEAGNWDVIIGLTPGALEGNARGRELLDRITYLDTIDDRVEKLWLSDMHGHDSYFLTRGNCHELAACYLDAYRARNGWMCATCLHRTRCVGLDESESALLSPFNRALLQRLFRGLPEGKGKARHLLKRLSEILEALQNNESVLDILARYIEPDMSVETNDERLARLAELYGPLVASEKQITLPANLLATFGLLPQPITLRVEPLLQKPPMWQSSQEKPVVEGLDWVADADKFAIRAWLNGDTQTVNRQSLLPLRRGLARWLRAVYPSDSLHTDGIAHPHRSLRWSYTHMAIRPPIHLEGVDEYDGIALSPKIGHTAFELYHLARVSGDEAKILSVQLAQDERLLPALFAAVDSRGQAMAQLEAHLGISVEELALALYVVVLTIDELPALRPPGLNDTFWHEIVSLQVLHSTIILDEKQRQTIYGLFDDVFKLRDNVYDGPRIARLLERHTPEALLTLVTQINAARLNKDYRLGNMPLRDMLETTQGGLRHPTAMNGDKVDLSPVAQMVLAALTTDEEQGIPLNRVPAEVWSELQFAKPEIYKALRVTNALLH